MAALVSFFIDRRVGLFALSLCCLLLLAAGIPRTGFDTSLSVLLTQSDPYLQERDEMNAAFPSPVEISFALLPRSGEVFEQDTLLALADLNREFRKIPLALSMNSILEWQSPFGDESLFARVLTPQSRLDAEELVAARARALNEPFLSASYISPNADLTLANVRLRVTRLDAAQSREIVQAADAVRTSLQARYPGVDIYVSSEAHYEQSNRDAMISDLSFLLPIVLLLCTGVICYSFRSVSLGASILFVAFVTVLMTVGSLAWAGWYFNTISVMAPLVVVTIAVADSVHIISLFRQFMQAGQAPVAAMHASLSVNFRPISLATITTIIGFASLNLASAPAVSSFGTVVAIGVAFAYALTLCVLPALVLLLPERFLQLPQNQGKAGLIATIIAACQSLVFKHGTALLVLISVLACLALALSFRNSTDFDRTAFISEDSPLHDYYSAVSARMQRGTQLSYGVRVDAADGVVEPAFLRRLDEFSQWLRSQEGVANVVSLVELVKTVNQIMHEEDANSYAIPDDVAAIDEALFNYSIAQASDFRLDTLLSDDLKLMRFYVLTDTQSNQGIIELSDRLDAQFTQQFPDAQLLHASSTLLFARMDKAVTFELLQGYAFSLMMITLTLIVGLRSVYYGLLSVLPNLLPAVLVFGVWGLFVGRIDPFVMMLFSISIGLVVDDTVHVLSTYQSGRAEGMNPAAAIECALAKAGPALTITTAVLALGTCVLIAASTLYFQQAATLLVPIVVLALLLDLTYFPALLLRFDRVASRPSAAGQEVGTGL